MYSPLAKLLHWIIAAFVVLLIPMGLVMADLEHGPLQSRLFMLHESIGVLLLAAMLLRIAERLRGDAPSPESGFALATHRLLYGLLLFTPLIGWAALSAFGLGPNLFGLVELPKLLAKDEPLSKTLFVLHKGAALAIGGLVLLHVAGALRGGRGEGGVIARMLPRART